MVAVISNKLTTSSGELARLPGAIPEVEGDLFRAMRFSSVSRSTMPVIEMERERHYFIVSSALGQLGVEDKAQRVRISQSYLPRSVGKEILLANLPPDSPLLDVSSKVLQARVRKTETVDGAPSYEYTVKLRNGSHAVTEKDELTFRISREEYEQMHAKASKGTIVKDRYSLDLDSQIGDSEVRVNLEIDLPLFRKIGGKRDDLAVLGYAMIDLEVADRTLMELLRHGDHDLSLLHRSIDISKDTSRHQLREPLSWKTLARQGVSAEALRSVLELKQLSEARLAA